MSNDPNGISATTIRLLLAFREQREAFSVFNDFDTVMQNQTATVESKADSFPESLKRITLRLHQICRNGFFVIQVCEWKIDYLAEAIIHALEANNPLSLANNTRGLVEHISALMFVYETLEDLRNSLDGQGTEGKIEIALNKAESILKRVYYGTSPKSASKSERAPHIESECLDAFQKTMPSIRDTYDFLCEFVHPNYGSNLLVSTGKLGCGRLNPPAEYYRETIDRICRYCMQLMLFLRDNCAHIVKPIINLQDYVNRSLTPGAKVSNVFSRKAAKPEGDGKTKETAFFFPKARTSGETIDMIYRYLRDSGIEETGTMATDYGKDGYLYDVFETTHGKIWFKTPPMKL